MHPTLEMIRQLRTRHRNFSSFLVAFKAKHIAEIGVLDGGGFNEMLLCQPKLAVAVDLWEGATYVMHVEQETMDRYYQSLVSLQGSNPAIAVHRLASKVASQLYPDGHFDFIYLDADHTFEGVKMDIECWFPKLRSQGVLSGHDYRKKRIRDKVCGIIQAVDEFVQSNNLELFVSGEKCPSWFTIKP